MIYKLRKRHFYTWILLAIILPLGFFLALTAIPKEQFNNTFLYSRPADARTTSPANNEWVTVSQLLTGQHIMLEVTINQPLTVPSSLLFIASSESAPIKEARLLGKLDSKNTSLFDLEEAVAGKGHYLLFFDPINKVVFHKIAL